MRGYLFIRASILGFGALLMASCSPSKNEQAVAGAVVTENVEMADIVALHGHMLTLDTHIDIPLTYMREIDPAGDTELQVDLPKLAAGQLDSGFWIIYTPQESLTEPDYATAAMIADTRFQAIDSLTRAYPETVALARTAQDVRMIVASGRHAVLIGMENAYPLGPSVANVQLWAERGVRYMGLTHFGHNQFGDSSNPHPLRDHGPSHNGLSDLGRDLVTALNDAGIMVDVSHTGKETMMQAADLSRTPIIASHSGARAIEDTARNLDDEQLRKIRDVGGVVQMVALGAYVKGLTDKQVAFRDEVRRSLGLKTDKDLTGMSATMTAQYEAALKLMSDMAPPASVADFVDHIDHVVKVAGINHVGIASDFDGGGGIVGWQNASETPNVTAELVRRGYTEEDIAKIWGGNLLRVMEAAESARK